MTTMDETQNGMEVAQNDVIKIKQEKFDPEIEQKINATLLDSKSTYPDDEERKPILGPNGSIIATKTTDVDKRVDNSTSDEDSDSSDCTDAEEAETEEKKSIEPVKSSNEILTELFQVFNAAPPEELLNDENLLKKKKEKKQHKKERKKKMKKSKNSDIKQEPHEKEDGSDTSLGTIDGLDKKSKHKKHKKHKRKSEKSKDKSKNKDKDKDKSKGKEKEKSKERDKNKDPIEKTNTPVKEEPIEKTRNPIEKSSSSRKRSAVDTDDATETNSKRSLISFTLQSTSSRFRERSRERDKGDKGHNSFYNGYKESSSSDYRSSRNERKSHNYYSKESSIKKEPRDIRTDFTSRKNRSKEDGQASEISLSDEETYLKERNNVDHRRHESQSSSSRYKARNAFYDGVDRQNSRDDRSRHSYRRRTRSRSRDLGIDKKRLLEIARKNAISMFKRGNLPGCADMSEEVKDKVLLKMRYGGRTVQDLTEFCKKLSNGENLNDISDLSSDEDSDVDKHGNAKAFNHPFMIKEREPIVMHIRGSAPISTVRKGEDLTKAITLQFPVSSGQQHRMTEAWVPVETKESLAPLPALPAAAQATSIFKGAKPEVKKNVFENSVPKHTEQEPAFKVTNPDASEVSLPTSVDEQAAAPLSNALAIIPTPVSTSVDMIPVPPTPTFVPDVPIPSTVSSSETVFPKLTGPRLDVSSIISKRLNAMRRLQDNPMDSEALKMMYNSQKEMTSWASSKHVPGQFTGSTGANVLSAKELSSGPQVWARRDQLTSTQPMTGGMGMQLLKKMGWKPGEGLGREKTGSLQPLLLDVKLDKRGLVSEEDNAYKRQQIAKKQRRNLNIAEAQQNLQDKHPVSLLNELTSKRKWTPPVYTLVSEGGPSHSKMFMFSVSINGQSFVPDKGSNTKKDAKVIAARHCLQQIGIIP